MTKTCRKWVDDENLPEPDFALMVSRDPSLLVRGYVAATNIRLLVEVSDSTLTNDVTIKARLCARSGIPEYWVVDLTGRRLLLHTVPSVDGYTSVIEYSEGETVVPVFQSASSFPLSDILP